MGKVRVYELAKELGIDSKALLRELKADGDVVRSASSTLENPVVQRLRQRHGQATPPQPTATAAIPHPDPGTPAPGTPTPGKPSPSAAPAPPPATSTPTPSVRRQDRQQRPSTPARSQRHGAWTINDLARKLRLDPAVLNRFLASHGIDTAGTLPDGLVEEVMARLLVNRNTSGPAQLVLMPGEALSEVAHRYRDQPVTHPRQERDRDQSAVRGREQQPKVAEDSVVDRSVLLWHGALRRWNAQRADLSRQVRSPQWSSNPRQFRSLSTHWSQVHLVDHHKALLQGLTDQQVKAFGMHRGTREALADAQLFWMPRASVNRISHTRTVDLSALVPRDVSTGLVAFESLVPADPAAGWLASSVPGVRDHAYRSLLWFIDANTVHVVGWRHAHPLAVTDPDGVDPVLLSYLHDAPAGRPVWNDAQLEQICASWPWVPATHFSYSTESVVDLASIPNPDQRACLAALALTWEDIAATRRPPRTRTTPTDPQREQTPEEQFEQHRLITPGTRYVQLNRTSLEELHRIGPDHQGQRTYHFSWMVRGHQRRQHYGPGGTLTKVIDIAPHQRGPRGAPMLGPKVYLLPPPR